MKLELSIDELARKVADTALDEMLINDRPLREWVSLQLSKF